MAMSLLAVEGLTRIWLLVKGVEQSPSAVRREMEEVLSGLVNQVPMPEKRLDTPRPSQGGCDALQPYYGMEITGGINALESYRKIFKRPDPSSTYFILVVGGSVAARFIQNSWEVFSAKLHEDPRFQGKKIAVVDYARGGFKQPQQTGIVAYLFNAGIQPDAVLNIDGFNEAALGFDNAEKGCFPLYPSASHWGYLLRSHTASKESSELLFRMWELRRGMERTGNLCLGNKLYYSAFLGRLALLRILGLRTMYANAHGEYGRIISEQEDEATVLAIRGTPFERNPAEVKNTVVEAWFNGSWSIQSMCDARSIHYLHVLQPTLHDAGSKPLTEEEVRKGATSTAWKMGVELCYPAMRERAAELKAMGINFHDLSMLFADVHETLYFDSCHFQGIGNEIFGAAVAKVFLDSLPPAPPAQK